MSNINYCIKDLHTSLAKQIFEDEKPQMRFTYNLQKFVKMYNPLSLVFHAKKLSGILKPRDAVTFTSKFAFDIISNVGKM